VAVLAQHVLWWWRPGGMGVFSVICFVRLLYKHVTNIKYLPGACGKLGDKLRTLQ